MSVITYKSQIRSQGITCHKYGLTLRISSSLQVHFTPGCRFTWLITLSCPGNAETSKSRSAISSELQTFLTSALIQSANQLLDCQSFLTRGILMAEFGGKRFWVGEIFSQYLPEHGVPTLVDFFVVELADYFVRVKSG